MHGGKQAGFHTTRNRMRHRCLPILPPLQSDHAKARVGSHVRPYTVYHVLRDIPTIRLTEGVSKRI